MIELAILDASDHFTGAAVFFNQSAGGGSVLVNLYLDTDDPGEVARAAEVALEAIWETVTFKPVSVDVAFAATEKPEDPTRMEFNAMDPLPIGEILALDGSYVVRQLLMIPGGTLAHRFGDWRHP